jgi:phosphomannomutase
MNGDSTVLERARAWIASDPDSATRSELQRLLDVGDLDELAQRMTPLGFGTAGLRGAVGAGPGRMNLAVVIRTAFAITRYLAESATPDERLVVLGFDARPSSRGFAEATAGVLLAAGVRVAAFPEPTATPLVAFFGRELGAAISVVVTASHNPRGDNGYKVYGASAVQIVAPVDGAIAAHIAVAPPADQVPRVDVGWGAPSAGLELILPARQRAYFEALAEGIPPAADGRELRIVHSALHGVGTAPMLRALAEAHFTNVSVVAEQAAPDGTFPTTAFPNPEEPGTLDLALATAEDRSADLLLVSDPDADRLAAAARFDGRLTVLDGNQLGALLADYCLSRAQPGALVLTSVVSSPLVERLCAARGARHVSTHTGFKWLWSAALELERAGQGHFCFAYEEALGYSVLPAVRDKDGISAGRALAEVCAALSSRGLTLFDRLFELYREHGLWASGASNLSAADPRAASRIAARLDALVQAPSFELDGERVVRVIDYRAGAAERPPWLGAAPLLELRLESDARLLVRPSGTEPKLKLYGHVRAALSERSAFGRELAAARARVATLLSRLSTQLHA